MKNPIGLGVAREGGYTFIKKSGGGVEFTANDQRFKV